MAILSNSWAEHLQNLGGNKDANKHMKAFTNALAPSKTIPEQVNALVEDVDAGILLVGPKKLHPTNPQLETFWRDAVKARLRHLLPDRDGPNRTVCLSRHRLRHISISHLHRFSHRDIQPQDHP